MSIAAILTPPAPARYTNDTRCGEVGPVREFREIHAYRGFVWVEALNGPEVGALLTFRADALRVLT